MKRELFFLFLLLAQTLLGNGNASAWERNRIGKGERKRELNDRMLATLDT